MPVPKGQRYGGRKRGVPNKTTIEAIKRLQTDTEKARKEGRELAVTVLERGMRACDAIVQVLKPEHEQKTGRPNPKDPFLELYGEWLDRLGFFASNLAKYQSPTFRAVMQVQKRTGIDDLPDDELHRILMALREMVKDDRSEPLQLEAAPMKVVN